MASFHNWTGDEEIDTQVPQFLNEDNAATQEKLDTKLSKTETAAAAIKDAAGNNIVDTYAKKTDISGMVKSVNGKEPDAAGNVNVEEYTHPNSGVTAGTYRSVTVNAQGHVTGGSNPTLAIADGGTGAITASQACANIGALPTSGGTLTGSIVAGASMSVIKGDKTKNIIITSGTDYDDSPCMILYPSESDSTNKGEVRLLTNDGSTTKYFIAKPSGELVWDGQQIYRRQASSFGASSGYIKFHDGTIIQYGHTVLGASSIGANTPTAITLPTAFSSTNYRVVASDGGGYAVTVGAQVKSKTQINLIKSVSSSVGVSWIAFGK